MKLELRKATDGTHFLICICGETTNHQLVIPLSEAISVQVQRMMTAEGIRTEALILPQV